MLLLTSILFSVVICALVMALLMWVKTPHYQVSTEDVQRLLEWMLLGQATENDWRVFCGYPIRSDPFLERIRQRCVEIDEVSFMGEGRRTGFLLDQRGMKQIGELLEQVQQHQKTSKHPTLKKPGPKGD